MHTERSKHTHVCACACARVCVYVCKEAQHVGSQARDTFSIRTTYLGLSAVRHWPRALSFLATDSYLARKSRKDNRTGKWALRVSMISRMPVWCSCSATCPTSKRPGSWKPGTQPRRAGVRALGLTGSQRKGGLRRAGPGEAREGSSPFQGWA